MTDNAAVYAVYQADGYVSIPDLFSREETEELRDAFDELDRRGAISVGAEEMAEFTDTIFLHDAFDAVLRKPHVITLLTSLLGPHIELHESKFINKPRCDRGWQRIDWHQDFAFYPHTNFDLLAFGVHLDDEDDQSGPVRVIPGSHRAGPLPHCAEGRFLHRLVDLPESAGSIALTGPRGFVTVHHCLAIHSSDTKAHTGNRRILYYEVRAQDNVQLAGWLQRSSGYAITQRPANQSRYARFPDGTRIELRGAQGRLCDPEGVLAPAPPS